MRQKYQILMEDKNGVWQELELGSDKLYWTQQSNNIAELENRNASYSQNIKLPRTAHNINIFEFANCFDVFSDFPYQKHNCRVYCGDRAIAGKGSCLTLLRVTDYFECVVLSGIANFFDTLKDSKMSDLDLGVFQVCNASFDPASWHPAYKLTYNLDTTLSTTPSQPFVFLDPDTGERIRDKRYYWMRGVGSKYPVLSFDYILQLIMSTHGYTLVSNIDSWKDKYLSIASADVDPTAEDLEIFNGTTHDYGYKINSSGQRQCNFIVDNDGDGYLSVDNTPNDPGLRIGCFNQRDLEIIVNVTSPMTAGGIVFTVYADNGDVVDSHTVFFNDTNRRYPFPKIPNHAMRFVTVKAVIGVEPTTNTLFGLEYTSTHYPSNAGAKLVLSKLTGFESQFDFIKMFSQVFGLTFDVIEKTKTVHAFTMDLLYDNVKSGNVNDWSSKALSGNIKTKTFTLNDYAKENIITLSENKDGEFTDEASFAINNQTLKNSTTIFEIPVESGQDISLQNTEGVLFTLRMAADVPLIKLPEDPEYLPDPDNNSEVNMDYYLPEASFPEIKPHLLTISNDTVNVSVRSDNDSVKYDYQIAKHYPASDMVSENYKALYENMLNRARIIEDVFYLIPEDIESFDPSIPVYIEKYGAYFYVNKIRNFELGKLTTCELIKL